MQHLLEAEQWVAVDAHASFQAVIDRWEERCPGLGLGVGLATKAAAEASATAAGRLGEGATRPTQGGGYETVSSVLQGFSSDFSVHSSVIAYVEGQRVQAGAPTAVGHDQIWATATYGIRLKYATSPGTSFDT